MLYVAMVDTHDASGRHVVAYREYDAKSDHSAYALARADLAIGELLRGVILAENQKG